MNYERMFMASVAVLAEITEALGIPADVAATSNGSAEMLAAIKAKHARIAKLEQRCEHLKQQAQIHAQEARTANQTIAEIYQLCSGAKGEPGNWNGAEPVRAALGKEGGK